MLMTNPTDDSGRPYAPHYDDPAVRQNFKRCDCHPGAQRHRFGKTLVCNRDGCETNWHQHQLNPRLCEGGPVPAKIRAHREDA